MKKIFLILFLIPAVCWSQDTTKYRFVDIMGITKAGGNKSAVSTLQVEIFLDFGKGEKYTPDEPMKDEKGNPVIFTSIIDMLNYLSQKGWFYVGVFPVEQYSGTSFERHFTHVLMKKPIK
ncbi:MAG: hypothetical protein NTX61_13960 [Bacteroidetes bacterium]|nr:hypothetical protein [Bacteroidota bacterium]